MIYISILDKSNLGKVLLPIFLYKGVKFKAMTDEPKGPINFLFFFSYSIRLSVVAHHPSFVYPLSSDIPN